MKQESKDFQDIFRFIERCESGEIKYFVKDQIDQYRTYFQFIDNKDENDPRLKEEYPPQNIKFSGGFPDEFSKEKSVRFSSFTFLREISRYKVDSIRKKLVMDYIEWIIEYAEEIETSNFRECLKDYPISSYLEELDGIFMPWELFHGTYDSIEFWHHDEYKSEILDKVLNGERLEELNLDSIVPADDYLDCSQGDLDFYFVLKNGEIERPYFF